MYFKSNLSPKIKIFTALISFLLVIIQVNIVIYFFSTNLGLYLGLALIIPILVLYLYFYFNSPRGILIDESSLNLIYPLHAKKILLKDIKSINQARVHLVFLSGSKGLFGYIGRINGDKCQVKDESKTLKIVTKYETFYVSCETPEKLVESLNLK